MPKNALRVATFLLAMLPLTAFAQETITNSAQDTAPESNAEVTDINNTSETPKTTISERLQQEKDEEQARKNAIKDLHRPSEGSETNANSGSNKTESEDTVAIQPHIIPASFKTSQTILSLEHHGYLRARLSYLGNYDLDTRGTSPVASPMNSEQRGLAQQEFIETEDSDAHFGADIRFRYQPTLHITESARIHATFDILDNFALGSTPPNLLSNWGADAFYRFEGVSDTLTGNPNFSVLSVKGLYGEVDTLIGTFRAGRVPTHWGLGIVYNDGGQFKREEQILEGRGWSCTDCDSFDAIDKIEWTVRDPFIDALYLSFSWDFVNSGISSAYNATQDPLGRAFDLDDTDDVLQFTISIFDRPISQREIDERFRKLYEKRQWTADWGAFFTYRHQINAPDPDAVAHGTSTAAMYTLYEKEAYAYAFDLWGRFMIPLPAEVMLRVEAEFVGNFANVKNDQAENGKSRDIMQFGAAVETDVTWKDLNAGLKTGFAWSDNLVYSGHPLVENSTYVPLGSILRFDSSYTVDEIMFKQLMGGVNNAWYANLFADYKFPIDLNQITTAFGARLDVSTSIALEPNATPGQSLWYGFEGDLKLYYEEADRFRFELGAALFVPGETWTRKPGSLYPVLPASNVYEDDISISEIYEPGLAWGVFATGIWLF